MSDRDVACIPAGGSVGPTFIFASDSFKGTLSSTQIAGMLTEEAHRVFPQASCRSFAIADGGEGTMRAIVDANGGRIISLRVQGPRAYSVAAHYGLLADGTAIVETAAASGLTLVAPEERDPLAASSYGTGQLIRAALDAGARTIYLGLGGSATVDGGMGMLAALGVKFWDAGTWAVPPCGENLQAVSRIDLSGLDDRLRSCRIIALSDVTNPLVGPQGAARVFGPQKGADSRAVAMLEAGMRSYAQVLEQATGISVTDRPGAGAAGGLGAACIAVLKADLVSGIECLLDLVRFDEALAGADLCVTGEGRLDSQTLSGKAVSGIARRCKRAGIPCAVIVGSRAEEVTDADLRAAGIDAIVPCVADGQEWDQIRLHAKENYRRAARKLFADWRIC